MFTDMLRISGVALMLVGTVMAQEQIRVSFSSDALWAGGVHDTGSAFSAHDDGSEYGWMCDGSPINQTTGVRAWGNHFDRYDDCTGNTSWQIKVPDGLYGIEVTLPKESHAGCSVQGNATGGPDGRYVYAQTINVTDQRVTVSGDIPDCHSIESLVLTPAEHTAANETTPAAPHGSLKPAYTGNYTWEQALNCGGTKIDVLEDGTKNYWDPGMAGPEGCEVKCTASATCTAFGWKVTYGKSGRCEWMKDANPYCSSPTEACFVSLGSVHKCKGQTTGGELSAVELLSGEATQSSTAYGGSASRAVDGNSYQDFNQKSCTHTSDNGNTSWWRLTLPETRQITTVEVWNRNRGFASKSAGAQVFVDDQLCGTLQGTTSSELITCGLDGSVVEVRLEGNQNLVMCEVQIFGEAQGGYCTSFEELAQADSPDACMLAAKADSRCADTTAVSYGKGSRAKRCICDTSDSCTLTSGDLGADGFDRFSYKSPWGNVCDQTCTGCGEARSVGWIKPYHLCTSCDPTLRMSVKLPKLTYNSAYYPKHMGQCLQASTIAKVSCRDTQSGETAMPQSPHVICTKVVQVASSVKYLEVQTDHIAQYMHPPSWTGLKHKMTTKHQEYMSIVLCGVRHVVQCEKPATYNDAECNACTDDACRASSVCQKKSCVDKKEVKCDAVLPVKGSNYNPETYTVTDEMRAECSIASDACTFVALME